MKLRVASAWIVTAACASQPPPAPEPTATPAEAPTAMTLDPHGAAEVYFVLAAGHSYKDIESIHEFLKRETPQGCMDAPGRTGGSGSRRRRTTSRLPKRG
ncbi:MAG: hypothetical protein HC923_00940, partial [Myxococcales bacterium]|nr:hypothetical protein [Myxococcales bacterium]